VKFPDCALTLAFFTHEILARGRLRSPRRRDRDALMAIGRRAREDGNRIRRAAKSFGLHVYTGRPLASAVAAIIAS